jgi:uncharacterized membrane protein
VIVDEDPTRTTPEASFEGAIGRLLITLTYAAVVLLAIGVVVLFVRGISPLSGGPPFDLGRLVPDIAGLAPAGFLWLGLLAVIAAPVVRVSAAAVGYARAGDRAMVLIAIAILAVLAVSVLTAIITTS